MLGPQGVHARITLFSSLHSQGPVWDPMGRPRPSKGRKNVCGVSPGLPWKVGPRAAYLMGSCQSPRQPAGLRDPFFLYCLNFWYYVHTKFPFLMSTGASYPQQMVLNHCSFKSYVLGQALCGAGTQGSKTRPSPRSPGESGRCANSDVVPDSSRGSGGAEVVVRARE